MPGLLRGMARTAVVAGTATAVSNRVSRRQAERWAAQDAPPGTAVRRAAARGSRRAARPGRAASSKLKELAALKQQGVLTDQEFETREGAHPRELSAARFTAVAAAAAAARRRGADASGVCSPAGPSPRSASGSPRARARSAEIRTTARR